MSVIATRVVAEGVARIFFDLRPQTHDPAQEARIAAVIEQAIESSRDKVTVDRASAT